MIPPPSRATTFSSLRSLSLSSHQRGTRKQTSVTKGKDATNRPPKRDHATSTNDEDSEHERRYVYVPECSRCRDRGFVCRTVLHAQEGQHSCAPCKLKKANCSATRGQNRIVEQLDNVFTVKEEPGLTEGDTNEVSRSFPVAGSASGPPSKRQRSMFHFTNSKSIFGTLSPLSECTSSSDEEAATLEETSQDPSEPTAPLSESTRLLSGKITNLDKTVQELHTQLSDFRDTAKQTQDSLNEIIKLVRVQKPDRKGVTNIEQVVQDIVQELVDSQIKANGLVRQLHTELSNNHQKADRLAKILFAHQQKHHCEFLYAEAHIIDAAQSLHAIMGSESEDVIAYWIPDFTKKCLSGLERLGDEGVKTGKHDDALVAYSAAVSLGSYDLLIKWIKTMLLRSSTNDTLDAATTKFKFPKIRIYLAICVVLEVDGHIAKAIQCFRQMQDDVVVDERLCKEEQWVKSFQQRCAQKLGELADRAMSSQNYQEATEHFSTILSLDEVDRVNTLIKRSKAWGMMNSWENALKDANEVITLKKSSRKDDQKHVEVAEALETMLLKF